jgi:hypothetical protein
MDNPDPRSVLATLAEFEQSHSPAQEYSKRRFRRLAIRGEAELQAVDRSRLDQKPIAIQLRDVGLGGLGFVAQAQLAVNSLWRCTFTSHGLVLATQTILVRHCREIPGSLYLVGCQFCIDTGLLRQLGVEPATIHSGLFEHGETDPSFVAPGEVD